MTGNAIVALRLADTDNVASIFTDVKAGVAVSVKDRKGGTSEIVSKSDIPYGHKIAVCPIRKGEPIIKYGEEIGLASTPIKVGEHVHVHNVESNRGRGDRK